MVPTLKISAVQMLGLAALGVAAGTLVKRRVPLFDRLNIPTPIVGGMLYAVVALALRDRVVNFDADVVLRDLLMVAFMTTIGLSARLQLIREGGARVIWFLGIASLGAVLQNLLGIAFTHVLGRRLHGVLSVHRRKTRQRPFDRLGWRQLGLSGKCVRGGVSPSPRAFEADAVCPLLYRYRRTRPSTCARDPGLVGRRPRAA